jgi:hypothetical protein
MIIGQSSNVTLGENLRFTIGRDWVEWSSLVMHLIASRPIGAAG